MKRSPDNNEGIQLSDHHESLSGSRVKGWSWGGLEVSKKVEKLHSEPAKHYLNGVLINLGALCNMVGNQRWNNLTHQMCIPKFR